MSFSSLLLSTAGLSRSTNSAAQQKTKKHNTEIRRRGVECRGVKKNRGGTNKTLPRNGIPQNTRLAFAAFTAFAASPRGRPNDCLSVLHLREQKGWKLNKLENLYATATQARLEMCWTCWKALVLGTRARTGTVEFRTKYIH